MLQIRFKLREGVGRFVGRAPWKIEWGGGSSVENPHYQRVHYCELLVRIVYFAPSAHHNTFLLHERSFGQPSCKGMEIVI
jgi:hypothetical protein